MAIRTRARRPRLSGATENWRKGRDLWDQLRFEAAQLDLLAGRPVRDAASALVVAHENAALRIKPTGASESPFRRGEEDKIDKLHAELVTPRRGQTSVSIAAATAARSR
jgi:hypothetical protein